MRTMILKDTNYFIRRLCHMSACLCNFYLYFTSLQGREALLPQLQGLPWHVQAILISYNGKSYFDDMRLTLVLLYAPVLFFFTHFSDASITKNIHLQYK